ncbi:hypothetical protein EUX98_g2789 [Antrodiella citrinella]|uniref:Uncharacterized protein n=1 Tax=Antrodiella citrinella TaxID=2447956 RepID=A0A4S4N0B5_9APHY|nr:hypothetical protein EUX98_g2789 [Antrodiella citrinella]
MVSPSKKLQASAPFMVPETNVNFPLVVVQPSGWETQAPGMDEDEQDEARTYDNNVARAVNHVPPPPQQPPSNPTNTQSATASSSVNPPANSRQMATPLTTGAKHPSLTKGPWTTGPVQGEIYTRPAGNYYRNANGLPNETITPNRDNDSIASSRASPAQPPPRRAVAAPPSAAPVAKATEVRGEKRRLDDEEHEDEEAAEVEKAMGNMDGDGEHPPESNIRSTRNIGNTNGNGAGASASASGAERRPVKKTKVEESSSEEDELDNPSNSTTRHSPRKAPSSTAKKIPPPSLPGRRKSRPVPGEFVGSGRLVPIKDRPFGEPTCHRCRNMKNQPACILHSGESRCDKCIVDAQGCWWRKGTGVYQSIAGTSPQKKLVDPRDHADLKKAVREIKKKPIEKPSEKGKKVIANARAESDDEEEKDSKPLTRKSLRVAVSASKAPDGPSAKSSVVKKKAQTSARSAGNKSSASKDASKAKRTSGRNSKRTRRPGKKSVSESESESSDESDSESDEEGSSMSSASDEAEARPAPPPAKALKGKAARREDPDVNQQLQRFEKAEAKLRDELWALAWEKERLLKTERRLQEELEELLVKKVQVRAGGQQ